MTAFGKAEQTETYLERATGQSLIDAAWAET
jgi:hypothetical protein